MVCVGWLLIMNCDFLCISPADTLERIDSFALQNGWPEQQVNTCTWLSTPWATPPNLVLE